MYLLHRNTVNKILCSQNKLNVEYFYSDCWYIPVHEVYNGTSELKPLGEKVLNWLTGEMVLQSNLL